ncbi:MAG: hypothetical protein AB1505_35870 [Candidatus Latescibacterota bacterium]
MSTRASLLTLIQELEGDHRQLQRAWELNQRAWERIEAGAQHALDWGALAFTLHMAYGILEGYFLRISKFYENDLPAERWHRTLVERMALDIPGVRPALLTDDALRRATLELLGFRHRFRHLYGEELDAEKTSRVQQSAGLLAARFAALHQALVRKLAAIGEELA